jgi:predicted nucleic acid-binding protein
MILVDANVILDILTDDPQWFDWSADQLVAQADEILNINPIIYAELCAGFRDADELEAQLANWNLRRLPLPYEAAFPASHAYVRYRNRGGTKTSPLPDFYIGAHAQIGGMTLLTRDTQRYESYFPDVPLISPD